MWMWKKAFSPTFSLWLLCVLHFQQWKFESLVEKTQTNIFRHGSLFNFPNWKHNSNCLNWPLWLYYNNVSPPRSWLRLLSKTFRTASSTHTVCWCVQMRKILPSESVSVRWAQPGVKLFPTDLLMNTNFFGFFCIIFHTKAHLRLLSFVKKQLRSRETALFNCGCKNRISVCTVEVRIDRFSFSHEG